MKRQSKSTDRHPVIRVPFESFTIDVRARFVQSWELKCWFRLEGTKLRVVFSRERDGGYYRNNSVFTRPVENESPWTTALRFASGLDVYHLIPPQVTQNRAYFDVRCTDQSCSKPREEHLTVRYGELVAVALLRQDLEDYDTEADFRDRSMYGKALLTLNQEQVGWLAREFRSFIDNNGAGFPAFLAAWRRLDALDDFDREDLGGFLKRFGFGRKGVTTRKVLQLAKAEIDTLPGDVVEARKPKQKTGLKRLSFAHAEELGLAGVSLTWIGSSRIQ